MPVVAVAPPVSPPVPPLRILVVDDNVDICRNFMDCAVALGHSAGMATTEAEGKAMISTGEWDCAVVDWWFQGSLPGGGGRVIATAIAKGVLIPCALITALPASDFKAAASILECFPNVIILHKPTDPISVINVLRGMAAKEPAPQKEGLADG